MSSYTNISNQNAPRNISSLDRINKINEKLNNIQYTIKSENNPTNNQIEERLISLHQKNFDSQEELFKEFSEAKRDLSNLIHEMDQERQQYELIFNERKNYLKNLEKKINFKIIK